MDDDSNGFSFGVPSSDKDAEEVEAIEVDIEPVSRSEARKLGVPGVDTFQPLRESVRMRLHRSTGKVSNTASQRTASVNSKLREGWAWLEKGEVEQALTLGQELVWSHPNLQAAKQLIARCFISRKEFDKALAILSAIPEAERDADAYYYSGVCRSRLGQMKEAMADMRRSEEIAQDAILRKRANEFIHHLQGELLVCPICGRKAMMDSMVEAGDQLVCLDCANSAEQVEAMPTGVGEDDDDIDEEEEEDPVANRRRRLRPPRTTLEIVSWVALLLFVLAGVIYLLYLLFPEQYNSFRNLLPRNMRLLPSASVPPPEVRPAVPGQTAPRVVSTLTFSSPPLGRTVVGRPIEHRVEIQGMRNFDARYSAAISPAPVGGYTMNEKTGDFAWTPAPEDGGRNFTVTFGAAFGEVRAVDQVNRVRVSSGLRFERVGEWGAASPTVALHLLAEDMNGDDVPELILASGEYWRGEVRLLTAANDRFNESARVELPGRPVGAGVVRAGQERWLAVADYWNSRIRFYGLRDGSLAEIAVSVELPGRPILAGFSAGASLFAALCRTHEGLVAVAYQQIDQLYTRQLGTWIVPDEYVWRALFIAPAEEGAFPLISLLGGDGANSLLALRQGNTVEWSSVSWFNGALVDAVANRAGQEYLLLSEDGNHFEVSLGNAGEEDAATSRIEMLDLGTTPVLGGLALLDLTGNGAEDVLALTSGQALVFFRESKLSPADGLVADLPVPSHLFGSVVVWPGRGAGGDKALYVDNEGGLWRLGLAD